MFKKYPSITNHYLESDIDYFQKYFSYDLLNTDWILQEKIHGANISILLNKNEDPQFFSRNNKIDPAKFYNSTKVFSDIINEFQPFQKIINKAGFSIRLYGELFGMGIQKGVKYGPEKQILFFDMLINDKFISPYEMEVIFLKNRLQHLLIPKVDVVSDLKTAINYDIKFNSKILRIEDNICEGVVIKPWNKIFVTSNGSIFYIKKKNEEFKEKQKIKKPKVLKDYGEEVNQWHEIFISYIHKERLESVFSKIGRINHPKDLGKYIHEVYKDVIETFLKEENFDEEKFSKKERKFIMNGNKEIAKLLKKELGMV